MPRTIAIKSIYSVYYDILVGIHKKDLEGFKLSVLVISNLYENCAFRIMRWVIVEFPASSFPPRVSRSSSFPLAENSMLKIKLNHDEFPAIGKLDITNRS